MFGKFFTKQVRKQPIAAKTLNDPIADVERLGQISLTPPLDGHYSSSGTTIRKVSPQELDARITSVGTGGKYGWRGIVADVTTPGSWIDLDSSISGTSTGDAAQEGNGNATLTTGTRIHMKRTMGQWIFWLYKCS